MVNSYLNKNNYFRYAYCILKLTNKQVIMKTILLIVVLFSVFSCKTIEDTTNVNSQSKEMTVKTLQKCPDYGDCKIEIYKNKSLLIKKDGIGKMYYELVDATTTSVVYFEYSRRMPEDLQDASYREEVVFEIDNKKDTANLTNTELKQVKMLFGKHCFCRSEAGYYNVNNGNLQYNYTNENLEFSLDFKVPEVSSQAINSIIYN